MTSFYPLNDLFITNILLTLSLFLSGENECLTFNLRNEITNEWSKQNSISINYIDTSFCFRACPEAEFKGEKP